jgi:hypothetical protein
LKIPVAGILRIMPAGTRKVIQMKKYTWTKVHDIM